MNTYYYHSDHLGSAQLISDFQGKEYERIEYTPYGETWIEKTRDGLETLPFRFTGKELDEETGFYYYGARYLNPKTSVWISADPALGDYMPVAPVDDEAKKHNRQLPGQGGVFNLVNLNLYHYAANNPIKYVDPDGKYSWDSFVFDLKSSIGISFNLDFGNDCRKNACISWNNKDYLSAGIWQANATMEIGLDMTFAFLGAKSLNAIILALPLLYNTIASISAASTVVLGKYGSGSFGGYTQMAQKIGAKSFQLPANLYALLGKAGLAEKFNAAWLDAVIKSGAKILLNSNPYTVLDPDSSYALKIGILKEAFNFKEIIINGQTCWEAIAK